MTPAKARGLEAGGRGLSPAEARKLEAGGRGLARIKETEGA